jgi:hypothetical protein
LATELLLWPSVIRRRFYQTRGHQPWPENCFCGHLLSGDVSTKQGVTKLGRRITAVAIYQVMFIPNKGSPNLAGELLLWPSAIRRPFYQTRGHQTWPENSCCGHLLSSECLGPVVSHRNVGCTKPHGTMTVPFVMAVLAGLHLTYCSPVPVYY